MKKKDETKGGGLFRKIKARLSNSEKEKMKTVPLEEDSSVSENLRMMEEYSSIKQNPDHITGWDFDRAFDFLENYPDSSYVAKIKEDMYSTNSETLKGLSYPSAVKILQMITTMVSASRGPARSLNHPEGI